jgi:putative transcriptional regulator
MSGRRIIKGLNEAIEYARGKRTDARVRNVKVPEGVDIQAVRKKLGLSQKAFAFRFGFTLSTVQNWEQGHRQPEGSARVLLKIIEREPEAVDRALAC